MQKLRLLNWLSKTAFVVKKNKSVYKFSFVKFLQYGMHLQPRKVSFYLFFYKTGFTIENVLYVSLCSTLRIKNDAHLFYGEILDEERLRNQGRFMFWVLTDKLIGIKITTLLTLSLKTNRREISRVHKQIYFKTSIIESVLVFE